MSANNIIVESSASSSENHSERSRGRASKSAMTQPAPPPEQAPVVASRPAQRIWPVARAKVRAPHVIVGRRASKMGLQRESRRNKSSPLSVANLILGVSVLNLILASAGAQHQHQPQHQQANACDGAECGQHAECQLDHERQPVCVCQPGYLVPSDGPLSCRDVNECETGITTSVGGQATNGSQACGTNAVCTNKPGSFECHCPPGYLGNPRKYCSPAPVVRETPAALARAAQQQQQQQRQSQAARPLQFPSSSARRARPTTSTIATSTSTTARPRPQLSPASTRFVSPASSPPYARTSQAPQLAPARFRKQKVSSPRSQAPAPSSKLVEQTPIVQVKELEQEQEREKLVYHHQNLTGSHLEQTKELFQREPVQVVAEVQQRPASQLVNYELPIVGFQSPLATTTITRKSEESHEESHNFTTSSRRVHLAPPPPPPPPPAAELQQQYLYQVKEDLVAQAKEDQQQKLVVEPAPELEQYQIKRITTTTALNNNQQQLRQEEQPVVVEIYQPAPVVKQVSSQVSQERLEQSKEQHQQRVEVVSAPPTQIVEVIPTVHQVRVEAEVPAQVRVTTTNASESVSEEHRRDSSRKQFLAHYTFERVLCSGPLQCPGNLQCLGAGACGCPEGYEREADFCLRQRRNCASSQLCLAHEDCVAWRLIQDYYETHSANSTRTHQIGQLIERAHDYVGLCVCPRGYRLIQSGPALACVDINECDEFGPCAPGAICRNKIGSFECVCPPHSHGDPYLGGCVRHECMIDADCPADRYCNLAVHKCETPCFICGPLAICVVLDHVASCTCPPRMVGNYIDLVYNCAPTTTTSTSTTTTTTTTTTTPAPPDSTTPEVQTVAPSELLVGCQADGVQVELQQPAGLQDGGIMYVRGHSQEPNCRRLIGRPAPAESEREPADNLLQFKVPFGACGLVHEQGEAKFVLVLQRHPKLVTSRARAYNVRCLYETGERSVEVGVNVSAVMKSGTIANTGPPPSVLMSITSLNGSEISAAELGEDLLLRVDVQPDNIYGAFARSCEAITSDAQGQEEEAIRVTDERGCALDPAIFKEWQYDSRTKSLRAQFSAFKFPSSNSLSFQCHMRVCFGSCPPVNCNGVDALAARQREKRQVEVEGEPAPPTTPATANASAQATPAAGRLDLDDELVVSDAFKEGTLKEDIVVKSNTILTFGPRNAPILQQEPQVEDIEFVCMPWLGVLLSILLTLLLSAIALCIALSCWRAARRDKQLKPQAQPLPHPQDFPNPMLADRWQ